MFSNIMTIYEMHVHVIKIRYTSWTLVTNSLVIQRSHCTRISERVKSLFSSYLAVLLQIIFNCDHLFPWLAYLRTLLGKSFLQNGENTSFWYITQWRVWNSGLILILWFCLITLAKCCFDYLVLLMFRIY